MNDQSPPLDPTNSPQKDIQNALLSSGKKRRRKPGDIPYPLYYKSRPKPRSQFSKSTALLDVENWDHIYRKACLGNRLTLIPRTIETPPHRVLDLGCGSGLWVLEAAQEWPDCQLWGYDCNGEIQPRHIALLCPPGSTAPQRIKWVQGNFLEGLPFEDNFFDFVRVTLIGLGVPEDEWQDLLEDIHRVLAPGGTLEIFEEDLIFPCGPVPEPEPPTTARLRPPKLKVDLPMSHGGSPGTLSSRSTMTFFSDSATSPFWNDESPTTPLTKKSGLSPLLESPPQAVVQSSDSLDDAVDSDQEDEDHGSSGSSINVPSSATFHVPPLRTSIDSAPYIHPQDHSRLKQAWDAMLNRRFVSPSLVSVIPFYISTMFENIMTHSPVEIELPKNSSMYRRATTLSTSRQSTDSGASSRDNQYFDTVKLYSTRRKWSGESTSSCTNGDQPTVIRPQSHATATSLPAWAPMHLAKSVHTVLECKEAIWEEYSQLFASEGLDLPPAIVRSPKSGYDFRRKPALSTTYETFERDWMNWENDMMDRIECRKHITTQLAWPEPITDRPEWRVWRSNMDVKGIPESGRTNKAVVCRSMRGFMAIKAGGKAANP